MCESKNIGLMLSQAYTANTLRSETTSIPTNPRTTRPVGYAFVDVSTPSEAERAINELNGLTILDRKVSVQLARKPEPAAEKAGATEGGEGQKRRPSTRGRGRGRDSGSNPHYKSLDDASNAYDGLSNDHNGFNSGPYSMDY